MPASGGLYLHYKLDESSVTILTLMIYIGSSNIPSYYISNGGQMDDIKIYNYALSDNEIKALYWRYQ